MRGQLGAKCLLNKARFRVLQGLKSFFSIFNILTELLRKVFVLKDLPVCGGLDLTFYEIFPSLRCLVF